MNKKTKKKETERGIESLITTKKTKGKKQDSNIILFCFFFVVEKIERLGRGINQREQSYYSSLTF